MTKDKLQEILKLHDMWLNGESGGERANLKRAYLEGANLNRANLYRANLEEANLYRAKLEGANLEGANLNRANLEGANLEGANLKTANLYRANLEEANLEEVNLDFSCLPLWCGGLNFKIDKKQLCQLKYHLKNLCDYSGFNLDDIDPNESHLITEHGLPKLKER